MTEKAPSVSSMENKKQVAASSSSSLDHLFGPKDSNSASSTSTTGYFGSIFPPPLKSRRNRNIKLLSQENEVMEAYFPSNAHKRLVEWKPKMVVEKERKQDVGNQVGTGKAGNPDNASINGKNGTGKDASFMYQNETMEPSYFSSSIFYGGQENYSPRTKASESHHKFKKECKDDDANGSNSNSASRGNWWEGSLYY